MCPFTFIHIYLHNSESFSSFLLYPNQSAHILINPHQSAHQLPYICTLSLVPICLPHHAPVSLLHHLCFFTFFDMLRFFASHPLCRLCAVLRPLCPSRATPSASIFGSDRLPYNNTPTTYTHSTLLSRLPTLTKKKKKKNLSKLPTLLRYHTFGPI
jgi:hypothetical protein